ncbi:glycosyltransferase family 2 protein [Bosea sp. ASV33]|uniref:glycosyltransferase family 2 protein n=1 Tax=Bosea sp. ASV33 TaxID=2795106 RepID=UPI0018EBB562|nr:glycosyltransferase family 2 protein [Bosea sp. ASV33]
MDQSSKPLVSVVTPAYNGEKFLRECIDSVLAQTHQNFEYIILNNASTDATLDIAEEYSRRDSRVRVFSNDRLLPIIANHNKAFGLMSADSKYCKVVSADDWIYPECLEKMVGLAETYPSAGIIGAYQLSGGNDIWYVRNVGLPYSQSIVAGHDICRAHLLGMQRVLGNPTSVLYRADLIRENPEFFPNATQEADISACLQHLRHSDFGFVHQILAHERIHHNRATTLSLQTNAYVSAEISDCQKYGDFYLSRIEKKERIEELLDQYYDYLSVSAFKLKDKTFWNYHITRLQDLGYQLDRVKLATGISKKLVDLALNPKITAKMIVNRIHSYSTLKKIPIYPEN